MDIKKNKVGSTAVLAFVYIAFFAVQLFFNFDLSSNAIVCYGKTPSAVASNKLQAAVHLLTHKHSKKPVFRLNKRFQPQNLPSCNYAVTNAPVLFLAALPAAAYCNVILPADYVITLSLRGPPSSMG